MRAVQQRHQQQQQQQQQRYNTSEPPTGSCTQKRLCPPLASLRHPRDAKPTTSRRGNLYLVCMYSFNQILDSKSPLLSRRSKPRIGLLFESDGFAQSYPLLFLSIGGTIFNFSCFDHRYIYSYCRFSILEFFFFLSSPGPYPRPTRRQQLFCL